MLAVACYGCGQQFGIPQGNVATCPFCMTPNQVEPASVALPNRKKARAPPNEVKVAIASEPQVAYPEVAAGPIEQKVQPEDPRCGLCFYTCCKRPVKIRDEPIYCLAYPCDIIFDAMKILLLPCFCLGFGLCRCLKPACCSSTCGRVNRMLQFDMTRAYIAESGSTASEKRVPHSPKPSDKRCHHCCDIGEFQGDDCCCNSFFYFTCRKDNPEFPHDKCIIITLYPLDVVLDVVKMVLSPLLFLLGFLGSICCCRSPRQWLFSGCNFATGILQGISSLLVIRFLYVLYSCNC